MQSITPATGARACLITVSTNGCYMTFDGTTPSSSAGVAFPKDGVPAFFPVGKTIKFVSQAAANCVVNVAWLK